jgi:hypothetical protein
VDGMTYATSPNLPVIKDYNEDKSHEDTQIYIQQQESAVLNYSYIATDKLHSFI